MLIIYLQFKILINVKKKIIQHSIFLFLLIIILKNGACYVIGEMVLKGNRYCMLCY